MPDLYLVRHGQASVGAEDYDQLSEIGFEQARLLGEWLARNGGPPARVVIGGMKRHRQTAETCLRAAGARDEAVIDLSTDHDLNEFDHVDVIARFAPELAGRGALLNLLERSEDPRREFKRVFAEAVARWSGGEYDAEYTESWPSFRARCLAAFQRLRTAATEGSPIWIFTSGGPISTILRSLSNGSVEDESTIDWSLQNCGVTRLWMLDGEIGVGFANDLAHLQVARRADLLTYA